MNNSILIVCVLSFCSFSAMGQDKKNGDTMKVNDLKNEITIEGPHALKVIQKGQGNKVTAEQADGITVVEGSANMKIIRNGSNEIRYSQSDSAGNQKNSSVVRQSGEVNNVMIRQNGSGNSISVSQSGTKKE